VADVNIDDLNVPLIGGIAIGGGLLLAFVGWAALKARGEPVWPKDEPELPPYPRAAKTRLVERGGRNVQEIRLPTTDRPYMQSRDLKWSGERWPEEPEAPRPRVSRVSRTIPD